MNDEDSYYTIIVVYNRHSKQTFHPTFNDLMFWMLHVSFAMILKGLQRLG